MVKKKTRVTLVVICCITALALGTVAAGCASNSKSEPATPKQEEKAEPVLATTMEGWEEAYPDQYKEWTTPYLATSGSTSFGADFSHSALMDKIPAFCEGTGKKFTSSCLSCKSSTFNTIYADKGLAAYNQPIEDIEAAYDIQYFTCEVCHDPSDMTKAMPNMVTFNTLAGDTVKDVDTNTLVCAQCHNSIGKYVYGLNDKLTLDNANPYRYGISYDGVYKAYLEDGQIPVDKATGAAVLTVAYTDFDTFYGSNHYNMGLTCVDCHMPAATDGAAHTNHNASSSPLENEAALEKCLTCHKAQGVNSTADMVAYYQKAEDSFAETMKTEAALLAQLKEALTTATTNGVTGEGIDKARDCYSKAFFYNIYCTSYNHGTNLRIAHDTTGLPELANEIIGLCNDGLAALA